MKTRLFNAGLLLVASLLVASVAGAQTRQTALSARLLVKVVHVDEVRRGVLAEVGQAGGFHTLVTEDQLRLKVPPERLSEVLTLLGGRGLVLEKSLQREDLTEHIAQLEGRLRSKEQILTRLRSFFDDSNLQATLEVERNMSKLVEEMEALKGRLRVERDRARWATVDVSFRYRERERVRYVRSPFGWLNTVDLEAFIARFQYGD